MAEKTIWGDDLVKHLIDVCKEEILAGNRPQGIFTRIGWKNVEDKFFARTKKKCTKTQLKNKLDNLKKDFTQFMELKIAATGLGWNEANQTVDCSNTWWDEHLEKCNNPERGTKCNHVRFRKHGPKHLDDLHFLFDKVHVTGATAMCPGDVSSCDSSSDDVLEVTEKTDEACNKPKPKKRKQMSGAAQEKEEKSPFYQMYKNTCMKIESAVEKISTSVEASSAPLQANLVPTIAEAMKMVKACGIQEKTAMMHTATSLIMKAEFREILFALETNEGRFDLIEREHKKSTT
ncbi:L10-interacting MYB domain-containing protein-like [Zea mays]|uniref:Myb/SANT-like domain-containing protein n=1 Tax=Zea mays TaxID=4577 RepID=A0A1D6NMW4_MAIZE|nr:L10-interacting MYB domain-containing protein-like [Zea mays]ONM41508.1 hypothetical protein ZEAMMB73_Zm00001d044524 [Zea mays]